MLVYGVSTAAGLVYETYCYKTTAPTSKCCYGTDSGSAGCYVNSGGCYKVAGISIACGDSPTPGNYVSNAKVNGTQVAGCAASGNVNAKAWCSYSSCGCAADY